MQYSFNLFGGVHDKEITHENSFDVEWSDIVEILGDEPLIIEDKSQSPAFNLCIWYEVPTKNLASNVIGYSGLVLDYDAGETIAWAKEYFADLTYIGYTSHSHLDDGVTEKFRIVIPFTTPCPIDEWSTRIESIAQFAGGMDPSSTARSRIFFCRSCKESNVQHYRFWHNEGLTLDWDLFEVIEKPIKALNTEPHRELTDSDYDLILAAIYALPRLDYEEWMRLGWAMKDAGYHLSDFRRVGNETDGGKNATDIWLRQSGEITKATIFFLLDKYGIDWKPKSLKASAKDLALRLPKSLF